MRRVWLVVTFALGAVLLIGALLALTADRFTVASSGDLIGCYVPTSDSVYASSTWSWLPPGKVCHYPDRSRYRPHWRGELAALVAIPLGATLVVPALVRFDDLPPAKDSEEEPLATDEPAATSAGSAPLRRV